MAVDFQALTDAVGAVITAGAGASPSTELANLTAVFDATEDPQEFPYLVIGEHDALDASTQCVDGLSVNFPIHIFTREKGFSQCKAIEKALVDLFDNNEFSVSGHKVISCFHNRSRFIRDPDRNVRHGIVELSIDIEVDNS